MPDRIDLIRCLCRALSLDDGGRLAPDLSRLSDGGWISRDGAVRLALELAEAADGAEDAAVGLDLVRAGFPGDNGGEGLGMAGLGVVLGGGGVMCAAELGVLQALAEWSIRPAVVTGTSGGGIVAGALAAGVPLDALVASWRIICAHPERYGLAEAWHALRSVEPEAAPGLFTLRPALEDLLLHAAAPKVGGWRTRYGVAATNVRDGSALRIQQATEADMATVDALQATSSFPGLFSGVRTPVGDLLQDGGLLDNLPADYAVDLGADRLLSVSFDGPLGALPPRMGLLEGLWRSVAVAVRAAQRPAPDVPTLRLVPDLPAGSWLLSFRLFDGMRAAGYAAAQVHRADIEAMAAGTQAA